MTETGVNRGPPDVTRPLYGPGRCQRVRSVRFNADARVVDGSRYAWEFQRFAPDSGGIDSQKVDNTSIKHGTQEYIRQNSDPLDFNCARLWVRAIKPDEEDSADLR
jgi:hypothetical protein